MKLTQIDNACCIYEVNGFKLLCDPWLTDGAFEGSWYHYPPLVTTFEDVKDVDALYISHLHPDHYDEKVLSQFVAKKCDIPIVVLDHEKNFLHKKLTRLGFTNLIRVKDKETVTLGPMEITVYAPFTIYPFDHSELGNLLDSALVVEANGKTILNANDNTPDNKAAHMLYERHGAFTVAQLKDSLAGAYPSCFLNLSNEKKLSEAQRLIDRQLSAMCEVAVILKAEWFQPFAGDYQLGGSLVPKNRYLGVAGKKYSAEFITSRGLRPLILNEQGSIDLVTGELKATFRKNIEPYEKWTERASQMKYRWETDLAPDFYELRELCTKARQNLWKWQERFNFKIDYEIDLHIQDSVYTFNLLDNLARKQGAADLSVYMDERLLFKILKQEAHWNNAEIGSHIDFIREGPYNPDVSMIMSFFHI